MVKRKRGADSLSIRHLEKFQEDISRALKEAKGFERQRMSKRQRDIDITAEKREKLEREINVLKVRRAPNMHKRCDSANPSSPWTCTRLRARTFTRHY